MDKSREKDGAPIPKDVEPSLHGSTFLTIANDTSTSPPAPSDCLRQDDQEDEPAMAETLQRSMSSSSVKQRNKGALYEKVGEDGVHKMHKFTLYETASRYYLVGGDIVDRKFRILNIDRTADPGELCIAEDDIVYTRKEMAQLLDAMADGNRASGGLKPRCQFWGILGFIRFTGAYYMLLITKRSQVAMIGGHYIYQVDGTELVPLTPSSSLRFRLDRDVEEHRFVGILNNLDLSRSFYFSYSYDVTRTLQHNILREREALREGQVRLPQQDQNAMFVWNHHLLEPALKSLRNTYDWCIPIVHGFVNQASDCILSPYRYPS